MRKRVLWGHHLAEYRDMFALPKDLSDLKLLEFGSGPTAINAELSAKGLDIVSCDPWFDMDMRHMQQQFQLLFREQVSRVSAHPSQFDFEKYGGIEVFLAKRQEGMQTFFKDFPQGFAEGRYCGLQAGKLPFSSARFDLALCSNYLFADIPEQNLGFHLYWIQELTRVAREVRFYPLTDQEGRVSDRLGEVLLALQQDNYQVAIENVPFRLVPASKAVLKVSAGCCHLD
jgi:hypothetical protein